MNTSSEDKQAQTDPAERKHWLYRSENLPKLWIIQIGILVLALVPEFFIHHHLYFEAVSYTHLTLPTIALV